MLVRGEVKRAELNQFESRAGLKTEVRMDVDDETAGLVALTCKDSDQDLPGKGDVVEAIINRIRTIHGERGSFTLFVVEDWSMIGRREFVASGNGRTNA